MKKYFLLFICLLLKADEDNSHEKPRVSIITSVYNGDEFIEGFLQDITRLTIFNQAELIIINANSPGSEEAVIKTYMKLYPQIIYHRLAYDPGLYAVWNYAITLARADFITNANIDDRRNPLFLEKEIAFLEQNSDIDLVYANVYISYIPHEVFESRTHHHILEPSAFAPQKMFMCLPGPQPVWRKDIHDRYGYFDESFYIAGDLEMWNRAASKGACFKKFSGISGVYYVNPQGLSTDKKRTLLHGKELARIVEQYSYTWDLTIV